jgi:hypothetical protein
MRSRSAQEPRYAIEESLARRLTESDVRALKLLVTFTGLVRPGSFGDEMWGTRTSRRKPQAFARSAGRVLNRLCAAGLARWRNESTGSNVFGYEATPEGCAEAARRS